MTGDVRIENLNIGNVFVVPGTAPEGECAAISDFLREQIAVGALTIIGEDGFPVSEEVAEPDDPPTPEEQAELEQAQAAEALMREHDSVSATVSARAKKLRAVAKHVTAARSLEGQRRGYASSPSERKRLKKRQDNAEKVAAAALEEACVLCEFRRDDCALTGDIKRWIDTHAYADKAKRRKDSGEVEAIESRKKFGEDLEAGVENDEQIHCDPAKRK